jgi:Flp pilus assembly protein TadB
LTGAPDTRCSHRDAPRENQGADDVALDVKEMKMLGIIAAVLIVLWLLGFFAFHVTSGLVHIILVVGLIMLLFHFLRGRSATA